MILSSQCMILCSSIIVSLYLMIYRISMQNCVQDLFDTIFSRYMCYDTVSTYDTTPISLIINYGDISAFCMHGMHDTNYDTTIVTSLMTGARGPNEFVQNLNSPIPHVTDVFVSVLQAGMDNWPIRQPRAISEGGCWNRAAISNPPW
jgi:hypothetical protein